MGSPWTSNISNMTRKFGLFSDLEPKPELWELWPKTPEAKTEEKIQDTTGMPSKEGKTSSQSTPGQAASDPPSELEEDNADPDSPEDKLFHTWVIFEGDLDPVRLDQLSAEQEHAMENGMKNRFVDIEDSSYMIQKKLKGRKKKRRRKND